MGKLDRKGVILNIGSLAAYAGNHGPSRQTSQKLLYFYAVTIPSISMVHFFLLITECPFADKKSVDKFIYV